MSATELLFRADPYLKQADATIVAINDKGAIVLDRTLFYPTGGGQPGDTGTLRLSSGPTISVVTTVWDDPGKTLVSHVPAEPLSVHPTLGEQVLLMLDWEQRYRRMKMHTGLHLLSVALPYPVTGGSVGADEGRLDFDIAESGFDKDEIAEKLNGLIAMDASVTERWITDADLDANPSLVKTLSVQPPRGSGRIRLIEIAGLDVQPCGGTHVRNTREIGPLVVTQIEKKGKQNRRVRVRFADVS
jgi:misacylated tRNA(Ala) deacylase